MDASRGNVLVTGATRGIGRAVVDAVLERGGRVVAVARDVDALEGLRAAHPSRVEGVAADLCDVERLEAVVERAVDAFGSIEGLVNCAGIARYEPLGAIAVESVEAQLRVNLVAPLLLSQGIARHMRARGGSIVNVSSTLSKRVTELTAVYAATKAGLNALTKSLAVELAPHGIRVNAVLPGAVDTDMLRTPRLRPGESLTSEEEAERVEVLLASLSGRHPLGRLGTPTEIAAVIVETLDHSWQTGSLITIDGGLSLA